MAYVDLNPVRAGIATTPEASEFTSIYARIQALRSMPSPSGPAASDVSRPATRPPLLDFQTLGSHDEPAIPFLLSEYLALVDWTGRAVRSDQRGAIAADAPTLLRRLNIEPDAWQEAMQPRGNVFGRALGRLDHLRLHAKALGLSWIRGLRAAERLYRSA
jgi:hypothetical protein